MGETGTRLWGWSRVFCEDVLLNRRCSFRLGYWRLLSSRTTFTHLYWGHHLEHVNLLGHACSGLNTKSRFRHVLLLAKPESWTTEESFSVYQSRPLRVLYLHSPPRCPLHTDGHGRLAFCSGLSMRQVWNESIEWNWLGPTHPDHPKFHVVKHR